MSKVAVYVRVSTVGQNIDGQQQEIERWLKGNRIDDAEWYVDKASGTSLDRSEFERLQRDIFRGKIKTVVIWKLDRLSRSLKDGIAVLSEWCSKGLRIISVTQQLDFNGALGKLLTAVLLAIGEMENETRKERQAAGIAAAKATGAYLGRHKGTTKAKPDRVKILKEKGLTVDEIAQAMGVSQRTVFRYLSNLR